MGERFGCSVPTVELRWLPLHTMSHCSLQELHSLRFLNSHITFCRFMVHDVDVFITERRNRKWWYEPRKVEIWKATLCLCAHLLNLVHNFKKIFVMENSGQRKQECPYITSHYLPGLDVHNSSRDKLKPFNWVCCQLWIEWYWEKINSSAFMENVSYSCVVRASLLLLKFQK